MTQASPQTADRLQREATEGSQRQQQSHCLGKNFQVILGEETWFRVCIPLHTKILIY